MGQGSASTLEVLAWLETLTRPIQKGMEEYTSWWTLAGVPMTALPVSTSHSQMRAPTGQQITAITTITRNLQQQSALCLKGELQLQALPAELPARAL